MLKVSAFHTQNYYNYLAPCCMKCWKFQHFIPRTIIITSHLVAWNAETFSISLPRTIIITSHLVAWNAETFSISLPRFNKNFLTLRRTGSYFSSVTQHWFLLLQWITMPFFVHGFWVSHSKLGAWISIKWMEFSLGKSSCLHPVFGHLFTTITSLSE